MEENTRTRRLRLGEMNLAPGQGRTDTVEVSLVSYRQAGIDYAPTPAIVAARLDTSAMNQGHALRLRFATTMHGPCARCLEPAQLALEIDAHEVHDPQSGDDELQSDFVAHDGEVLVTEWARDAVGLAFPQRVLCTADCAGLCPQCGINRNTGSCDCSTERVDSRWDKLRELRIEADPGNDQ